MADDAKNTDEDQAADDAKSDDKALGTGGEAALKAERKRASDLDKQLKSVQAQLKELTDKERPESDVLNEKIASLEKRTQDAESAQWRAEVALEKGLTPAQARRLVGENKDALLADADDLVKSFSPAAGQGEGNGDDSRESKPRRPKEALKPGASTSDSDTQPSASETADAVMKSFNM